MTITDGRCPSAAGEIAVSADQLRAYETPVGSTIDVVEFDAAVSSSESVRPTHLSKSSDRSPHLPVMPN